jgi:hypothetical protein
MSAAAIHSISDNDVLSSWLDRRGYSELADELRPIHGRGPELGRVLADVVDKWTTIYHERLTDAVRTSDR